MNSAWTKYLPPFIRHKVEGNLGLQDVVSNTGWMLGDKVIRMGIGLLIGVWLARYLGPSLYGEFSYAFAFASLFAPIALLGLDEIVIRKLVRDTSHHEEILGTVFFLMLLCGSAVFVLATACIYLVRPEDELMHWLVAIMTGGTVFQAFIAIEFWFESQLQWKFTVFAKNSAFLIISILKIVLILSKASLLAFAWAALAETAIASVGLVIAYQARGFRLAAWRYSGAMAGRLLKDSWPVILSVFLTMIYLKIDQIMLGTLAGNEELGLYSAAVRLSEPWYFIPMAVCSSIFPTITVLETTDEKLFNEHMQKLYNLMALIAYCIAIPVALLSNQIVDLLYTNTYAESGTLLSILIWSVLFTNLSAARNVFMVSKNWLKINLVSTLLGCIVNILLNYFLIPKYGAKGAIYATLVSYWVAVHGTCFILKPLRPTGRMLTKALIYPRIW